MKPSSIPGSAGDIGASVTSEIGGKIPEKTLGVNQK